MFALVLAYLACITYGRRVHTKGRDTPTSLHSLGKWDQRRWERRHDWQQKVDASCALATLLLKSRSAAAFVPCGFAPHLAAGKVGPKIREQPQRQNSHPVLADDLSEFEGEWFYPVEKLGEEFSYKMAPVGDELFYEETDPNLAKMKAMLSQDGEWYEGTFFMDNKDVSFRVRLQDGQMISQVTTADLDDWKETRVPAVKKQNVSQVWKDSIQFGLNDEDDLSEYEGEWIYMSSELKQRFSYRLAPRPDNMLYYEGTQLIDVNGKSNTLWWEACLVSKDSEWYEGLFDLPDGSECEFRLRLQEDQIISEFRPEDSDSWSQTIPAFRKGQLRPKVSELKDQLFFDWAEDDKGYATKLGILFAGIFLPSVLVLKKAASVFTLTLMLLFTLRLYDGYNLASVYLKNPKKNFVGPDKESDEIYRDQLIEKTEVSPLLDRIGKSVVLFFVGFILAVVQFVTQD